MATLSNYGIEAIEDAFVAALAAQLTYADVAAYQGEVADVIEQAKRVPLTRPRVYVVLDRRQSRRVSQHIHTAHIHERPTTFRLFLIARDLRSAQTGATKTNGIYDMIDDCDTALLDSRLGLDVAQPVEGGDAGLVAVGRTYAIYAMQYTLTVHRHPE